MKIEDMIASVELCLQIPKNVLQDTALIWDNATAYNDDGKWKVFVRRERRGCRYWNDYVPIPTINHKDIPAPTMEELLRYVNLPKKTAKGKPVDIMLKRYLNLIQQKQKLDNKT